MFDLFRFMTLRSAQTVDDKQVVSVAAPTDFQKQLTAARAGANPRTAMTQLAQAYVAGPDYVKDSSILTYHQGFPAFYTQASQEDDLNLARLEFLVKDKFKLDASILLANADYQKDRSRIFDSIVAIKIALLNQPSPITDLGHFALVNALIERVAAKDDTLNQSGVAHEALQRIVSLPGTLFPLPPPSSSVSLRQPLNGQPADGPQRIELEARANRLSSAIASLMEVDVSDFEPLQVAAVAPVSVGTEPVAMANGITALGTSKVVEPQRLPFLTLKAEAIQHLAPDVLETLTKLNINLSTTSLPTAVGKLKSELSKTSGALNALAPAPTEPNVFGVGNQFIDRATLSGITSVTAAAANLPTTHGDIKPVGIADLLVVRQQLKRYEAGEISYIENILKSESLKRQTRRARITEQTFLTETETTKQEERDLQTAERFELKQETDTALKEDASLKVGVAVSASYGSMLEVKSNVDVATSTSKQVATKEATSYSKDVTNRAASKVTERVRVQQTLKIVEQFEETNEHGFDNTNGKDNIIGIYQWIDKIYEAQVFNYGKHLLFDVMVPEPAAFLLDALIVHQAEGQALVKPEPLVIRPDQLNDFNYLVLVSKYGASGVIPPPSEFVILEGDFNEKNEHGDVQLSKTAVLAIPPDYIAVAGLANVFYGFKDDKKDSIRLDLEIGGFTLFIDKTDQAGVRSFMLAKAEEQHQGSIPINILTNDLLSYTVGIEILCKRTQDAYTKWQLDTYGKILTAFLKLQSDYENKLAALAVQQSAQIGSHNPALNQALEQTELKKACISLLTATHLDFFSGIIQDDKPGKKYPRVDLTRAEDEGNYIRFFEQAFEWDQMVYFFYPYFWGRYANWYERVLLDDTDTTFAEFLRAGAARVVFPVRPGFESAIINFLDTGQILNFNDIDVSSPFYVPIIQEIKEREQAPGKEVPQGDPWEVRIPTNLVKLRADSSLPSWKKDTQGEWIPQ